MYGEVKKLLPDDASTNMGNYITIRHYVDANLFHDQLTGFYVIDILHLVNKKQLISITRNRALQRHPHMVLIVVLTVPVWVILLI